MILTLRRLLWVLIALASLPAAANTLSYVGNLPGDDPNSYVLICFHLNTASDIVVDTFGYGGGVNGNGETVGGTGFQSVLDLYDGSGNLLLDSVADPPLVGACPPANDDAYGFCGDADLDYTEYYSGWAPAGDYTLALLAFGNGPAGLTLADGFLGTGTFDGNDGMRDSSYAVDITGDSIGPCTNMPEPASLLLLGSALPWLLRLGRHNH